MQTDAEGNFNVEDLLPVNELIPNCETASGQLTIEAVVDGQVVATAPVTMADDEISLESSERYLTHQG